MLVRKKAVGSGGKTMKEGNRGIELESKELRLCFVSIILNFCTSHLRGCLFSSIRGVKEYWVFWG